MIAVIAGVYSSLQPLIFLRLGYGGAMEVTGGGEPVLFVEASFGSSGSLRNSMMLADMSSCDAAVHDGYSGMRWSSPWF